MPGPRRLRDRRADPRARALAAHPDHLPDRQLQERHARLPRLLGRRGRLPVQAVRARRPAVEGRGVRRALQQAAGDARTPAEALQARLRRDGAAGRGADRRAGGREPVAAAEIAERQRVEDGARRSCSSASSGAPRGAGDEPHEGRVPGHAVARAAHAAQRHPRLGAHPRSRHARRRRRSTRATRVIKNNAQAQAQLVADILDVSRIISGKLQPAPRHRSSVPIGHRSGARSGAAGGRRQGHRDRRPPCERGRADARRSRSPAAGDVEPAVERDQVHAQGRAVCASRRRTRPRATSRSPSPTPARASSRRSCRTSSSASPRPTARARRGTAGSGSGMAIVRHLVELHGGTCRVASAGKNQGSTFTVSLPIAVRPPAGSGTSFDRIVPPSPHLGFLAGGVES